MTKKKSTKRALISSLLILAMCFTMLAGTTFAWFTDTVESGNNIIKSGKLDIDLLIKADGDTDYVSVTDNPDKAAFNYELWEPGYTSWANAKVVNKGNLALKYTMKIAATGTVSALADVIDVYYAPSEIAKPDTTTTGRPADLTTLGLAKIGTLAEAINGTIVINDNLIPDATAEVADYATIVLHMQETAGNEYQNLSIGSSFKFVILATQYTYEADAFDNQYDAAAEFPGYTTVSDAAGLAAAIADPTITDIVLENDIANSVSIPEGQSKVIDMNGKTLGGVDAYGDVTLKNGEVTGRVYANKDAHVVVSEDAVLDDQYSIILWNDADKAVVDIYGELKGNFWVMGNITDSDAVVNVYGKIDGGAGTDVGLALQGDATVNVYDGAVITSDTAIEVRAGNLNVYGGTITATAAPSSATENNNGTTTVGAGIAVSYYGNAPINVSISGGDITGYNPLYIVNPNNKDYSNVKVSVTGGNFTCSNGGTVKFFKGDNTSAMTYTNALDA